MCSRIFFGAAKKFFETKKYSHISNRHFSFLEIQRASVADRLLWNRSYDVRHFLMASVHWTPKRCAKREAAKACIVFFFGRSEVCEYVMNNCISLLFDAESTYIYTLEDIKAHMPSTMSACGGCIGKSANSPPSGTRATCEQRSMQLSLLQSQPCQVCTQTMRFYFSIPYPCTWFSGFSVIQLRSVNSILQAQQKDLRS